MASRGLGTLTIDLVARTSGFVQGMDKSERASKKWRRQVEKDVKQVGVAVGRTLAAGAAAVTAAAAATVALTKQGMDAVRSQADLARSLDTTFDSITALNIAAGDVGLEGMEGSLTRLNRRLGAAERGAGAAANAVKELNLDLGALSNMPVDERIATSADAIKNSGVSMQRAARYAQDLGFEQQQAAEFFMQGGDAIRAYAGEVDALGLSLSDIDAQKVVDAQNAMGIFGDIVTSVSQRLAAEFSPILQQEASDIEDATREAGGLGPVVSDAFNTGIDAAGFFIDAIEGVRRTFKVLGSGIAVFGLSAAEVMLTLARDIVEFPTAATNELIDLLNLIPKVNIQKFGMSDLGKSIDGELRIVKGAVAEGYKDIQRILMEPLPSESLKKYVAEAREAAEESARAAVEIRENFSLGGGLSEEDLKEDLEAQKGYWDKWLEAAEKNLLNFGDLSKTVIDNFSTGFGNAIEGLVFDAENLNDALKGVAETILRGVVNSLAQMAAQWLALQAVQAIVGTQATAATVGQAAIAAGAWAPAAAAASLATVGTNAAPAAGALTSTHALSKSLSLTGMAHDGIDSVPQTGTWLLEKGERVMTSETSKKLDAKLEGSSNVVVNLYEDASKAGQVQQDQREDGSTEINIFVSDIMSNGPRAKAMQRAYGLRRQGT